MLFVLSFPLPSGTAAKCCDPSEAGRVCATVEVRVQDLAALAAVQPALEPPPGELHLVGTSLAMDGNEISVQKRRFGGIGFFMFDMADAQPLDPVLQLPAKLSKGQGYEALVVLAPHVGALLPVLVNPHDDGVHLVLHAPADDELGDLVHIVAEVVVPPELQHSGLRRRDKLGAGARCLLADQGRHLLVVPLVCGFRHSALKQEARLA